METLGFEIITVILGDLSRMPRHNPYDLQMQITRLFEQGQAMFATLKVQDWLRERQEDPTNYEILFHQKPAPPGSGATITVDIELRRKDGQPIEPWLQQQLDRHS